MMLAEVYIAHHVKDMVERLGLLEIRVRRTMATPEVAFIVEDEVFNPKKDVYSHWCRIMEDLENMDVTVNVYDKKTWEGRLHQRGW